MKLNRLVLLSGISIIVLIAGIIWSIHSINSFPGFKNKFEQRTRVYMELQTMQREQENYAAALQTYNALPASSPIPLAALLPEKISRGALKPHELETRKLEHGWQLQRMVVEFYAIELDPLLAFLVAAESQKPPWRLKEYTLSALASTGNLVQATCNLEAVGRPAPQTLPEE